MAALPSRKLTLRNLSAGTNVRYYERSDDYNAMLDHTSHWLNVVNYGAAGNGVQDDTQWIQAAIDDAWQNGTSGRTVYLPPGTYKTTGALTTRSGVDVKGAGSRYTIIKPTISSGAAFTADNAVAGLYHQVIGDMMIDGTNATGTARAIYILNGGNNQSCLERLWITNWAGASMTEAVRIEGSTQQIRFNQCRFLTNKRHVQILRINSAPGFFPTTIKFIDCSFEEAVGQAATSDAAVLLTNAQGVHFRSCLFESNATLYALWMVADANGESTDNHLIEGCYFEGNGTRTVPSNGADIYLQGIAATAHHISGVKIHRNEFHGTPVDRIRAEYTTSMSIRWNTSGGASNNFLTDGSGSGTHLIPDISDNDASTEGFASTLQQKRLNGADRGDASVTLTVGSDCEAQRFSTALTANRTVTLATPGTAWLYHAPVFRVFRTGGNTGGPWTLTVNGTTLSVNAWIEVQWDGSLWRTTACGSLNVGGRIVLTYSASIAVDSSIGDVFSTTATNNTAFTVANPTNAVLNKEITIQIRNTSGGALGAVTWDTLYKLAAWTSPATANSRSITFRYDGTNWVEVSRTTVDVPN